MSDVLMIIDRLHEEIKRLTKEGCAMGHVIVEAGINPGIDYPCRCEECKLVAVKLDDAGFMDDVKERWWDAEVGE